MLGLMSPSKMTRHNDMEEIMNHASRYIYLLSFFFFSTTAQAATVVLDTFDSGIGTWIQNTTQTSVSHSPTGGNPGGYLKTDNIASSQTFDTIGAQNTSSDYSGVFADGVWTVSVDLKFENGDFTDSWLRFRYQDSTANGWHISLEDTDFFNSVWQSYSVSFDTTWSDAVAIANGWVKEADGTTPTPTFSGLWDDVYNSEIRIMGSGGTMVAGIDNYKVSTIPVPASLWLLGSGLLGLMGIARRKTA